MQTSRTITELLTTTMISMEKEAFGAVVPTSPLSMISVTTVFVGFTAAVTVSAAVLSRGTEVFCG